jgi:3-oxoacyl-[acyl-carrier protein] reductase
MHTKGKNIIVSGGSRGLGLHISKRLLENNNRLATFARKKTKCVDELISQYGKMYSFTELDATDFAEIKIFVESIAKSFGSIDSLVNNAAIGQDQLLMHTDIDTIERIVQTNIVAPTILMRYVIKKMVLQGQGSICNISSICGSRGYTGLSVYAGSKGYLDAMMRSLSHELGNAGIYINCVAPGFFESEMSSVLLPEQLTTIKRRTPTGQLSNEEDIFKIVDLVISQVTNIQGQVIYVDGGITS